MDATTEHHKQKTTRRTGRGLIAIVLSMVMLASVAVLGATPAEAQGPPPGEVAAAGHVFDHMATAVGNATVEVRDASGIVAGAVTQLDGLYVTGGFQPGVYDLVVIPPAGTGLEPTTLVAIDFSTSGGGDITLNPIVLSGVVTTSTTPIEAAAVTVLDSTTTGVDGTYAVQAAGTDADLFQVQFSPASATVPEFDGSGWVDGQASAVLDIALPPVVMLTVDVVDTAGAPVVAPVSIAGSFVDGQIGGLPMLDSALWTAGGPGVLPAFGGSTGVTVDTGTGLIVDEVWDGITNPMTIIVPAPDSDVDGIDDTTDNCPTDANPDQTDTDIDGLGDICDPDVDGHGFEV